MNTFLDSSNFSYLINYIKGDINQKINFDITSDKKYLLILKKLVQTIHEKNINKRVSKEYLNNLVIDKCVPFLIQQVNKDRNKPVYPIFNENRPLNTNPRPMSSSNNDRVKINPPPSKQNLDLSSLQLSDGNYTMNKQKGTNIQQLIHRNANQNNQNNQNKFPSSHAINNDFISPDNNRPMIVDNIVGESSRDSADNQVDIMKKFQELENERNYNMKVESQNEFSKTSSSINEINQRVLDNVNSQSSTNDNEFYNKLYENNIPQDMDRERSSMLKNLNTTQQNQLGESDNDTNYSALEIYETSRNNIQNLEMSIQDKNTQNRQLDFNNNIDNLIENEKNNSSKVEDEKTFLNKTFLSTNVNYGHRKKKILSIDVSNFLPDFTNGDSSRKSIQNISGDYWSHFKVNLQEDLIIDKLSDVFLESVVINNPARSTFFGNAYILVDIEEFNIKTLSNSAYMNDKFVIPNENTEASHTSKIMKYHLKSNYVATVNPTRLSSLTFKITNEDNLVVGTSIASSSSSTVDNVPGYNAGVYTVKVDNNGAFSPYDAVYNSDNRFVGYINLKSHENHYLYFLRGTFEPLFNNEELFLASSSVRSGVQINEPDDAYGYAIGTTTALPVGSVDPTTIFAVGDKVFLGNGGILGIVSAMTNNTITFLGGTKQFAPDNANLYIKSPLPNVFGSNNQENRLIFEFVFISR